MSLGRVPTEIGLLVRAAREWRDARRLAVAEPSKPGAMDRLARAEHVLAACVGDLDT
jgi:hypothetical protein